MVKNEKAMSTNERMEILVEKRKWDKEIYIRQVSLSDYCVSCTELRHGVRMKRKEGQEEKGNLKSDGGCFKEWQSAFTTPLSREQRKKKAVTAYKQVLVNRCQYRENSCFKDWWIFRGELAM